MHDMYEIIKRPIVTEKATALKAEANKVCFIVAPWANKIEIRSAVERIFSVKVLDVHTARFHGKLKRMGKNVGYKQTWKKAIVTLAEGSDIDVLGTGAEV
ncbi:MAG: 50S ribosomal protein L23 [Pseudomonadota bacterium]